MAGRITARLTIEGETPVEADSELIAGRILGQGSTACESVLPS